jgi:diguanylate cyclase (GGDEF)-like protein
VSGWRTWPWALEARSFRRFFVSLTAIALCAITAVFAGFAARSRHLIRGQMLSRARAEFQSIRIIREWNSRYGGVWVEKRPGVESSQFLRDPDLRTVDGRVFTERNHAQMAREIGELVRQEAQGSVHLSSLRPLNPTNRPDPAEREALLAFERGEKERSWVEEHDGRSFFRYMAPLVVEPACLECHPAGNGGQVGDVRGGISVAFDVDNVERRMDNDVAVIAGAGALVFLAFMGPLAMLVRRLRRQLRALRRQLEEAATTDPLTGLANRRTLLERFAGELERHRRLGRTLGCVLLDIDHFKSVNDTCGHLVGDQVLRLTADAACQAVRPYDTVGRYGGEELLVLLPEANLDLAAGVAERLRALVASTVAAGTGADGRRPVTVSLGVTCSRSNDVVESVIARADRALYRAKQSGRNRLAAEA